MTASRDVLDQAYSLAKLEAFEPELFIEALAAELTEDDEPRDGALRTALAQVEELAARAMKLRLDHALALDASIPQVTRNVFATTILQYAQRLELLQQRVHDVAARGGSGDPDGVAMIVVEAARLVLALRDRLRVDVLELARTKAAERVAGVDQQARDKRLEVVARKRWSKVRRDLEAIAADPSRIVGAAMSERMAALDEQIDEPDPANEPTFASMIEMD